METTVLILTAVLLCGAFVLLALKMKEGFYAATAALLLTAWWMPGPAAYVYLATGILVLPLGLKLWKSS